jgi:hypothetical protein
VDIISSAPMPTGLGFTWLSTKTIGQSIPYPSVLNTLTVTLSATQDVSETTGVAISIMNLLGKSWPSPVINLTDPRGQNMHLMFMDSYPNGNIGCGSWGRINNKPGAGLVFYLARKWTLGTEVVLAFNVYNPALPVNIKTEVKILKIHFSLY